jgi:hypothetical protein
MRETPPTGSSNTAQTPVGTAAASATGCVVALSSSTSVRLLLVAFATYPLPNKKCTSFGPVPATAT